MVQGHGWMVHGVIYLDGTRIWRLAFSKSQLIHDCSSFCVSKLLCVVLLQCQHQRPNLWRRWLLGFHNYSTLTISFCVLGPEELHCGCRAYFDDVGCSPLVQSTCKRLRALNKARLWKLISAAICRASRLSFCRSLCARRYRTQNRAVLALDNAGSGDLRHRKSVDS